MRLARPALGLGIIGAAVLWRCVATAHGAPVLVLGSHLPAVMRIDFLTGPLALFGLAVLASAPRLGWARRLAGVVLFSLGVAWPALKFHDMGEVILTISHRHGVHTHDLIVFPVFGLAMLLLAPWRLPVRFPVLRAPASVPVTVPLAGRAGLLARLTTATTSDPR